MYSAESISKGLGYRQKQIPKQSKQLTISRKRLFSAERKIRLKRNIQLERKRKQANIPANRIPTYMRVPLKGLNEKKIRISE